MTHHMNERVGENQKKLFLHFDRQRKMVSRSHALSTVGSPLHSNSLVPQEKVDKMPTFYQVNCTLRTKYAKFFKHNRFLTSCCGYFSFTVGFWRMSSRVFI